MKPRILCVEDEDELRCDLTDELREANYDVVEASTGEVALESLLQQDFALLICDLQMPGISGRELLQRLQREGDRYANLPRIVLTAFDDMPLRQDLAALGVGKVLVKPVDYDELLDEVARQLAGRA